MNRVVVLMVVAAALVFSASVYVGHAHANYADELYEYVP